MDWLEDITKDLKLKVSFAIYLLLFTGVGLVIGKSLTLLAEYIKFNIIKASLIEKTAISPVLLFILNQLSQYGMLIILLVSLVVGFSLYYNDKLNPTVKALAQLDKDLLANHTDELNRQASLTLDKIEELEKTNIINMINLNANIKKYDALLHEIKNPLQTIKGDIHLLLLMNSKENNEITEILYRLQRNEERIETHIRTMTSFNHIKNYQPHLERIKVSTLWDKIIATYTKEKIITEYSLNKDYFVDIDLPSFFQALDNIVRNAEQHAKQQVTIRIEDQNQLCLIIHDDGGGFSGEALKNYNKAYYTENALDGNLGLGLYLAQILLDKQHMKLTVENREGACVKIIMNPI